MEYGSIFDETDVTSSFWETEFVYLSLYNKFVNNNIQIRSFK